MPGASAMLSMRLLAALLLMSLVLSGGRGAAAAVDVSYSLASSSRPGSPVTIIRDTVSGSRVLVSTDSGSSWRDATPRALPGHIYDVVFADARVGWLVSGDCTWARGGLFRTKDAGRTWTRLSRSARTWYTNCAAGSGITLDFVDRVNGWAVEVIANAPSKELRRTRDGGRTWRLVAEDRLPSDGRVRFVTPQVGWQRAEVVGAPVPGGLFRTDDGGRRWTREADLPRDRVFALPTALGKPMTAATRAGFIDVYERDHQGWRRISTLRVAARITDIVVAAPSTRARWLAARVSRRGFLVLFVSEDAGRTWARRTLPPGTREFAATSTSQAWSTGQRAVWTTRDGGRTWRRVRLA